MINCAPVVWRNLVIVTLVSGHVFAVDRNTQSIAWHILPQIAADGLGTALITGAEVYEDFVYANGSDQKVHAYRASDGTELWASVAGQLGTDLSVSNKFVYASNTLCRRWRSRLRAKKPSSAEASMRASGWHTTTRSSRLMVTVEGPTWTESGTVAG